MSVAASARLRENAPQPAGARPMVVSLHRPGGASGINAWGARMARLGAPHARWRVMVVGEEASAARAIAAGGAPGCLVAAWRRGAGALEQVRAVRAALREAGAGVVAPNDVAHGFVCAGLDRHRGLRALAVAHACSGIDEDFYARVGGLADAWAPVSEGARRRLGHCFGEPGGPTLPCGVMVPARAAPTSAGPGPLRLLFAGRLDHHCKRALDLPELCRRLDALGVDWTLTVAGDGSARAELAQRLARFEGRVSMRGLVPSGEMGALYRAADCLVLLSAFEGWPVTVIEAMASARAVAITTGCGGALDIIRDGVEGFIVRTGDMATLARRLGATDRPGLARMGAAAHRAARASLDLRSLADGYDRLVGDALRRPADRDARGLAARWDRIRWGLTAIEPAPGPDEMLGLALEWLGENGAGPVAAAPEVMGLLAHADPVLAGRVERIVGPGGARWLGWPVGPPVRPGQPILGGGSASGPHNPVIDLSLPERPNFASGCLMRAMERLRAVGTRRVVLYGAGGHTRRLGAALQGIPEIVGIVDDRAGRGAPERMWGLPVARPCDIAALAPGAIVISSDEHQEAMAARAGEWAGGLPVVTLYSAGASAS